MDAKCGKCHQPLFTGRPITGNQACFSHHLTRNNIPLLVDFWADWCGPCKMMAPFFQQAAGELEPEVRLIKINTQEEPNLASVYGIRSIPTLVLFKGGTEAARVSGAMDLRGLLAWTRQIL